MIFLKRIKNSCHDEFKSINNDVMVIDVLNEKLESLNYFFNHHESLMEFIDSEWFDIKMSLQLKGKIRIIIPVEMENKHCVIYELDIVKENKENVVQIKI